MRIPPYLQPGDCIGITAPSFGATTEPYITRFNEAVQKLRARGYTLKIGATCYKDDGLGISTNPKVAAAELMDFYLDKDTKAVFSCGGGELMCETMSFVDFERLKSAPPKWFMGFSDNTNFIHPLVTLCDTAAIYGHCITGFGKMWEQCETDTLSLIEGTGNTVRGYEAFEKPEKSDDDNNQEDIIEENPLAPYKLTAKKELKSFLPQSGGLIPAPESERIEAQGIMLGGCLDVLANLAGTRFDASAAFAAKHAPIIWALEACDYNPMDIRRALWHLGECGWFTGASAFVIGRPLAAWEQEVLGVNQYNAVTDILARYSVPVIMDADIGHIAPSMPLIMGAQAKLSVQGNDIEIRF